MFSKIFNTIIIIFAALFQISFLRNQYFPFNEINVILILVIFISLIDYNHGLHWALVASIVLEIYSQYPFGIIFLSYFITFFIIVWLLENFFTNKSFYSFSILGLIGTIVYNLLFLILNQSLSLLNLSDIHIIVDRHYLFSSVLGISINVIMLIILFTVYKIISKRMKTVFLMR